MTLREPWSAIKQRLLSSGKTDFASLVRRAGLDPARHMRFAEWSGVDFRGSDLQGFDFTGARLIGCNFEGARITGAWFDQALIDEVRSAAKLDPDRTDLRAAEGWRNRVKSWKHANRLTPEHLPPGAVFQDAPFAPEMVVVPPGRFMMGSKDDEGEENELPRHEVTVPQALAVGRFPVTCDEWDVAFAAGGVQYKPTNKRRLRRGRQPLISVSWHDAKAYVAWLAVKTGKPYRLLSEAEWEYVCRAETDSAYSFCNAITKKQARFGEIEWGPETVEVGSFPANNFGLYDMHGYVWEWCEDLWHESYADKPEILKQTGGAWTTGGSRFCVMRGGSWSCDAHSLRSSNRGRAVTDFRLDDIGFRVARAILIS